MAKNVTLSDSVLAKLDHLRDQGPGKAPRSYSDVISSILEREDMETYFILSIKNAMNLAEVCLKDPADLQMHLAESIKKLRTGTWKV